MPSCRRCRAKETIFYDHYEHKAKLNSIDGKTYDIKSGPSVIDVRNADIYLGNSSGD